jgi:ABC-2 type transport system ATP-binding protein
VNILEIQGLCKAYKDSAFRLQNVSFAVPAGTIVGFVGENGAGKSTTIGCILNTLHKDSGTVKIFGKEMNDEATDLRDEIGVVYDSNSFPVYLTPKKVASIMRQLYSRWDDGLFNEYLQRFKLPPTNKIKGFSRGMTMKLALAAALAHHPRLLVLDEATSGLDPIARDDVLDVFLEFVQDEGRSILMSSHITTDLEKVADYITFIHDGEVYFNEPKDKLIYEYGVMRMTAEQFSCIDPADALAVRKHDFQTDVLVKDRKAAQEKYAEVVIDNLTIDEIMLLIVKGGKKHA